MKTCIAMFATIICADIVFLLTGSFFLVGVTSVIGGASWAHAQENQR